MQFNMLMVTVGIAAKLYSYRVTSIAGVQNQKALQKLKGDNRPQSVTGTNLSFGCTDTTADLRTTMPK